LHLNALTDHRNALTSADASGCETVATIAATQLEQHRQDQSRARCRQRMTESDRATIHVCLIAI
jgi:hypothetical protein